MASSLSNSILYSNQPILNSRASTSKPQKYRSLDKRAPSLNPAPHPLHGYPFSSSQCSSSSNKNKQKQKERLSYKDIQDITRMMLKDKKSHEHNLGVLQNIKGKMYCLKLGEVSNFKQFSHYFYTSQYRRRVSGVNEPGLKNMTKYKKIITQPAEERETNKIMLSQPESNDQELQSFEQLSSPIFTQTPIQKILSEKMNKFMLPTILQPAHHQHKDEILIGRDSYRKQMKQKYGVCKQNVLKFGAANKDGSERIFHSRVNSSSKGSRSVKKTSMNRIL